MIEKELEWNFMRAAFYTQQGNSREVLQTGELPTPEPGPGEVRVRMRTSGVNPSDLKSRRGGAGRLMSAPLIIPHSDGAGDIDAVGAGLSGRMGERVWIWNGQWKRAYGTAAEYIVVPGAQAVRLPENVGYEVGACLGIPALTAIQAVRLAEIGPETTVLIAGGAGSVAHYAIQLAKGSRSAGDHDDQQRSQGDPRARGWGGRNHQLPHGRCRRAREGARPTDEG